MGLVLRDVLGFCGTGPPSYKVRRDGRYPLNYPTVSGLSSPRAGGKAYAGREQAPVVVVSNIACVGRRSKKKGDPKVALFKRKLSIQPKEREQCSLFS